MAERLAARGKRASHAVAAFEHKLADHLIQLRCALIEQRWRPAGYTHFIISEPKRRLISAAPFADRVVHHALCNVIEPVFDRVFIRDSYANRKGGGTHRAVDRCQWFCQRYPYVLGMDIVKHFPSIDHQILMAALSGKIRDERLLQVVRLIIDSGADIDEQGPNQTLFPGDDLLDLCRPRGLPIGNLTSQFWSNCYMHSFDLFVKRELGCKAYIRYVDDFVLFAESRKTLRDWRQAIIERLARLRLTCHQSRAQVYPTRCGIPWLGFVIYPTHRRLKRLLRGNPSPQPSPLRGEGASVVQWSVIQWPVNGRPQTTRKPRL